MRVEWLLVFAIACGDAGTDQPRFADAETSPKEGSIAVTWETLRGTEATTCTEARVATIDVRAQRDGDATAIAATFPCDAPTGLISGLAAGDYTVSAIPLDDEGLPRSSAEEQTIEISGEVPVQVPLTFTFPEGAQMLITWSMVRGGVAVPCSEIGADIARVWEFDGPGGLLPEATCDSHTLLSDHAPLGTHSVVLLLQASKGWSRLWFDFEVTLEAHEDVVVVPLIFEYFDEPENQLLAIAASAKAIYEGATDPKTFPPSSSVLVPDTDVCCSSPGSVCTPDPSLWAAAPWTTLGFSEPSPHRFSYQFESSGSGTSATFTVTARGDTDCDGELRHYEIIGTVDGAGNVLGADTVIPILTVD